MKYQWKKGTIVTITWNHGGYICKILSRPGQLVYDPTTKESYLLGEGKYVVYYEGLRIEHADYTATLHHGMYLQLPGIFVDEIHLTPSSNYEKYLRRKGVNKSPLYESQEPQGEVGEILAFKYPGKLRLVEILKIVDSLPPCFELSNGECIERGSLKSFYRKTTEYEQKIYIQKRVIKIGKSFLPLVDTLNDKRNCVKAFACQIEDSPVYITFQVLKDKRIVFIIEEPGTTMKKTIPVDLDDSITHFMFLLTLIKDEYKKGYLFTNKSHLHE